MDGLIYTLLFGAFLIISLGCLSAVIQPPDGEEAVRQSSGRWTATTPFNNPRVGHRSALHGKYLYVLGGHSYDSEKRLRLYDDVQYATLGDDGNIRGGWHTTTPFPVSRTGHSCVTYKGYLYVIAGGDGLSYYSDVRYAPINDDGSISSGAWHTSPHELNVPRAAHSSLVAEINGQAYLYVIGGVGDVNGETIHFDHVEYAPINPDGSIGSWTVNQSTFTLGRSAAGTALINGYVYVTGGWGDILTDIFPDVQYAHLKPDGSLGPWASSQYPMYTGRYGHACVLYPNPSTILVIGGNAGNGSYLNDLQYTTAGGGEMAPWIQLPADYNIPTARWGHTSVTYKGLVYVIGGAAPGGVFLNDVQYASFTL